MTNYTKAIEMEKKLKEIKAAVAKFDRVYTYMIVKSNELPYRTGDDIRSMLCQLSCDFNVLISKFTKLLDKAWFDFYAQEYEEEGEEND